MKKAQNDVKLFMIDNNRPVALIGTGLEPSVTDLAWETVISNM